MKKNLVIILALLALLAVVVSINGCHKTSEPSIQPLALWTFDGTLQDSTGNGHDGKPIGRVHYTDDRHHRKGRSLLLDSACGVVVSNVNGLDFNASSSYSITGWIRTANQQRKTIYHWGPSDTTYPGISLEIRNGKAHAALTSEPGKLELWSNSNVADDQWHLITLTAAPNDTVKLYVDTTLVAEAHSGSLQPQSHNPGPVYIGTSPGNTSSGTLEIARLSVFKGITRLNSGNHSIRAEFMDDFVGGPPITGLSAPSNNLLFACDDIGQVERTGSFQTLGFVWPTNSQTHPALRDIAALNDTHAIAVGEGNTAFYTLDGSNWQPLTLPTPSDQGIYSVALIGDSVILIAGGSESNSGQHFLYKGTVTGSWPNAAWTPVTYQNDRPLARALSALTTNSSKVLAAGWDDQLYYCNDIVNTPAVWTSIPPAAPNNHYTSVDLSADAQHGSLVADDGYVYQLSPSAGSYSPSLQIAGVGGALWTTLWGTSGQWAGGARVPGVILLGTIVPNGTTYTLTPPPSSYPTKQTWFSGTKVTGSGHVRMGGYEQYQVTGEPSTIVYTEQ